MDETQAETDVLRDLVQHPGWQVLMRNTKERMEQFRAGFPFNVQDERQLYFARGLMAALGSILSLEDQLEALENAPPESLEEELA